MQVLIKKLHPDAIVPAYGNPGDAGFDLHSLIDIAIAAQTTTIIPTGLAFAIPDGYEMQVRMRSSTVLKTNLIIPNAPGTIDAGYRGEVGVIVRNIGNNICTIKKGERFAQGIIAPVMHATFKETENLPPSQRGNGAFGSTG